MIVGTKLVPGFPLILNTVSPIVLPYVLTPGSTLSCGARLPPMSSTGGCRGTCWLTESPDVDIASPPPAFPAPSPRIAPCVDMVPRVYSRPNTHSRHSHSRQGHSYTTSTVTAALAHSPHPSQMLTQITMRRHPAQGRGTAKFSNTAAVLPIRHGSLCSLNHALMLSRHSTAAPAQTASGTLPRHDAINHSQSTMQSGGQPRHTAACRSDSPVRVAARPVRCSGTSAAGGAPPAPPQLLGWRWPFGGASTLPSPASRRFSAVVSGSETT